MTSDSLDTIPDRHASKRRAILECQVPDKEYTIGYRYAGQRGAPLERTISNDSDVVTERHVREIYATHERAACIPHPIFNDNYTIRYDHTDYACIIHESRAANYPDWKPSQLARDDYIPAWARIVRNGGFAIVDFIFIMARIAMGGLSDREQADAGKQGNVRLHIDISPRFRVI